MNHIGELNEQPLHKALKTFYAESDDRTEVMVDGYVVDIVNGEGLIEIQTSNFSSIKDKLSNLIRDYPVKLVYPIPVAKWLLKLPKNGDGDMKRRKSPKKGRPLAVFTELVSFPHLLMDENFSLELAMIQEEEVRRYVGKSRWYKNGWETVERRLISIVEQQVYDKPEDMRAFLAPDLPEKFTTADLAECLEIPRWLAQKMAYCLRKMNVIEWVGKRNRSYLYRNTSS